MIVGVDVSSRRIDLAWLEDGKPQRWHQELAKGHLIDRLRSIDIRWPSRIGEDVTDIAIEKPFSTSRRSTAALMSVVGIITYMAPPWARVAWPSAGELRAAISATNNKQDAHEALHEHIGLIKREDGQWWPSGIHDWDEHELDALVACTGWTAILAAQDAA